MATPINVDIGTGFYAAEALPLANQRCVNAYVEIPQTTALSTASVYGSPGITEIAISGREKSDANRGAWVKAGKPYFVNGGKIYRLDRTVSGSIESFALVELGNIEGTARCSFADNGTELLVLVPGGKGYIVDENNAPVVQEITDADFTTTNGAPQYVVYIDGYFVVSTDSKKFKNSNLNDGFTWTATDFGSAEVDPDDIVAPFVFKNQLYIAGSQTIETYQNIGGAGFPFQRINGFVIDKGVAAPSSIRVFNNSVLWVGSGETEGVGVWQLQGSEAVKVSTTAIDNKLQGLTPEQQAAIFSWSYSAKGHFFVGFVSDEFTLVYDMATGKWHERESQITDSFGNETIQRCRYNSVLSAYGLLLAGDSQKGLIGKITDSVYTEYGMSMAAYFTTSPLFNLGTIFTIPKLELFCQPGVGTVEVQNPVVNIRVSKNGYQFSDYKKISLGKAGDYDARQIRRHIGRVNRYCIFEFRISDNVERRFLSLTVYYKQGVRGG